jgi:hypothetical protein
LGVMALVCTPGWQFFADNDSFKREAKQNIRDVVRWHRNHPSAVLWEVSLNETYGHDAFYEECSNIAKEEYPGGQLLTSGDSYDAKRVRFYDIPYTGWGGSYSRPLHPDSQHKKALHREYGDMDLPWSVHVVQRNSESQMMVQAWNFQWAHNKNLSWPWTIGDVIWEGIDTHSAFGPSFCGPLDLYRLPKISYYFFQSQRDPAVKMANCDSGPMVQIAGFWTQRPSPTKVVAYSNAQEVELFLNGRSLGRQRPDYGPDTNYGAYNFQADPTWAHKTDPLLDTQKADALAKARAQSNAGKFFDTGNGLHLDHAPFTFVPVAYEPGELKAVAYVDGKVVATNVLRTPGKPSALRLRAATLGKPLLADGSDALFVYADVVDATGAVVPENGPVVTFSVEGGGHLIMPPQSTTEAGIAPMMVQSSTTPGTITVTATAPGLVPAVLKLDAVNPPMAVHVSAAQATTNTSGNLAVTLTDHGAIKGIVWNRPNAAPVDLIFRQDGFAGFSWHVDIAGNWSTQLPLVRVKPDRDEFALNIAGIVYSLNYTVKNDRLEVVAKIENTSGKPFTFDRALVNVGVDTEMAQYPQWNQRFFPTLLRCEKTHFWGYFMRPDGIIMGIASPDPVASWANGYNGGGHRLFTSCLDLFNKAPQPARHPQVNPTLAPGEVRQMKIFLVPMDTLAQVQPVLSRVAGIPMIALDRTTVEAGQKISGTFCSTKSPVESLTFAGPDGQPIFADSKGTTFSFAVGQPGLYSIHLKTADGKIADALAACRMPWSWYAKQARANAVSKPQKGGSHVEEWMGLFSGYIARRYFPDPELDAAIDAKYAEIAPILYDMNKMLPSSVPDRVQNHSYWASMLVDRYRATGDIHSLEFAASLADFVIKHQTPDGAYRAGYGMGAGHYSCVGYVVKSIMEVMAAEKTLAEKDPVWKARYDRHAASVRLAIDDLVRRKDNIGTEGEATYEDGMIACDYTQLAMYALLQTDPVLREKYLAASKSIALGHRCLSQILIPDCRMNGGSLRYWEAQYDILTFPDMMSSPHGWSAWQLYGLWYLYQVTGEKEYLREAMNGLGSCAQLIDFKTGDLRWGFIVDPYLRADVYEQDPGHLGTGIGIQKIIGEQYMPMISGWHRAKPNTWVFGYGRNQNGGSCDNDVHEIFRCLGQIALTCAYVVQNADGSLETWNCQARRDFWGTIVVTPAEAVVSRIHFNLKKPAKAQVVFDSKKLDAKLPAGMTWFGPGGIPGDIRP